VSGDSLLPAWRIHRHIGMGGDQLVPALTSEQVDDESGDAGARAVYHSVAELREDLDNTSLR
jgi:hypothetical protein